MENKPVILQVFLLLVGLVVFNWPMMAIAGVKGSASLFFFLFIAWILFIAVLRVVIRLMAGGTKSKQPGRSEDV